jgi:uncharacterized protein YegP (UPF0339 family)
VTEVSSAASRGRYRRISAFFIYRDSRDEYRWRLRDNNHEIIAVSGESYVTKYGAERAVDNVKAEIPNASVVSMVGK